MFALYIPSFSVSFVHILCVKSGTQESFISSRQLASNYTQRFAFTATAHFFLRHDMCLAVLHADTLLDVRPFHPVFL